MTPHHEPTEGNPVEKDQVVVVGNESYIELPLEPEVSDECLEMRCFSL